MDSSGVSRRSFIGGLAVLTAASQSGAKGLLQWRGGATQDIPYRTLGKTGEKVPCIGLGGFHLGQSHLEEADAIKLFHAAIDRGINCSDNSWDYNQGESERRVGKALQGYRQKVFVKTKFDGRTKGSALKQLDESLQRLQLDHVDLWQFHENIRLEDPDRFFAEGGASEATVEAKRAGKVRYIGFTGHKDPSVHLRMLDLAEKHNFQFDTAQMPINVMDAHFRSFEKLVVPVLTQKTNRTVGHEVHGQREYSKEQKRDSTAMPAICIEPSHIGGHYGDRQHGDSGSGVSGSRHVRQAVQFRHRGDS